MASIHREMLVAASPETALDAVRDVGAIHTRLAPGVVADTVMSPDAEPPVRSVTFVSGPVVDELIVDCDDERRRLVWSIQGGPVIHHNGVMQVFETMPGQSRVSWVADVVPHALAEPFSDLMTQGMAAMKHHLEGL